MAYQTSNQELTPSVGSLLNRYRNYLASLAKSNMPMDLQAVGGVSDLVQETYFNAVRDWDTFRGDSDAELRSWLRSILLHKTTNFVHRFRQEAKQQVEQVVPLVGQLISSETPSFLLMQEEEQQHLASTYAQLDDEEKEIVQWRHRDQLSYEEMGMKLQCSPEAARKRWARVILRWQRLAQSAHQHG